MTIRRQLVRLVAACVLPAALAATLLIGYSYQRQRSLIEERTLETARALTQAVDRELASSQAALYVLAQSPLLTSGDFATFHRSAQNALPYLQGSGFVLSDASGQQILNTLRPYGEPLPLHGNLAQVRQVFETAKPVTSDLFAAPVAGRALISIDIPVVRDDRVVFDLSMGISPDRLAEILTRENLPPDWIASIFDSQGTIVARTHDAVRYVGHKGAPAVVQLMAKVSEGRVESDTLEGVPVVAVFSRSAVSNWSVAIGIPRATLVRNLWTPVAWIIAGTVVLLGFGLTLAYWVASRIARAMTGLVPPAIGLAHGQPVVVPPSGMAEMDEVGRALTRASEMLRAREETLASVAHDLRSPLGSLILGASTAERQAARLPRGGEPLRAQIASLIDITRRMSGVVDDLLAVAVWSGSGKSMLNILPTNASALIARAADAVRSRFQNEGIELRIEDAGTMPDVRADPGRILRVFINLLDNALKFTAAPGYVVLRSEARQDAVQFSVANIGRALSADELDRMFQPFWQAGRNDARGAGLGLSICRTIMETHGGSIWAEPEPGMRVRICFRLPRAESHLSSQDQDPT